MELKAGQIYRKEMEGMVITMEIISVKDGVVTHQQTTNFMNIATSKGEPYTMSLDCMIRFLEKEGYKLQHC